MLKKLLTAAAVHVILATPQASAFTLIEPADLLTMESLADLAPAAIEDRAETIETAAYCEWVTFYDYWGNWQTFWQCY